MGKTNRNQPRTAASSEATTTLLDFERHFPDDATCLNALVGMLYPGGIYCPRCEKVTKHHRVKSRTCYECQFCGHQEYPMKGTIFEGSSTSLRHWFYAMYLMASTRCGISAKQLEREIGVSYPTAHRMFKKIRSLLTQDEWMMQGTIEMDEAFVGGKAKWRSPQRSKVKGVKPGGSLTTHTPVVGMAQRGQNGRQGKIRVEAATTKLRTDDFVGQVEVKVLPGSTVYTDDAIAARHADLGDMGYRHRRVPHSQKIYVAGDVHTNTIEGFWSLLKRGIGGVYHSVSTKHLQAYLDEYAFRYNNRDNPKGMFNAFLGRIEKASPPDPS
jgi:transposase